MKYAITKAGQFKLWISRKGQGKFPSIPISPDGAAAMSYYAEDRTIRYAKGTEVTWESELVDQTRVVPNGSTSAQNLVSLHYYPDVHICISYAFTQVVQVAVNPVTEWAIEVLVPEPSTRNVIGDLTDLHNLPDKRG